MLMKQSASLPTPHLTAPASDRTRGATATRWLGPALVGMLTLLFALVNWLWLRANLVTYGWDRMDHLISSLAYNDILRDLTPASLFTAFAWSDYYPPLVHLGAVAAYKLLGVDEDMAAMTNIVYAALLFASVWSIGRRVGGAAVGALATVIVATLPMIFAMSRYLYLDFALTCLVAASMATLLASERFTRRGPSLAFGLALGAAFLVKWTAAAFLAVPLLVTLWRGGVLAALWQWRPTRPTPPTLRRLALALGAGLLLVGGWVWAGREVAAQQPLGLWLAPLLGLIGGVALFALHPATARGATPLGNALSAGVIALFTLSLWYLTNINFLLGFYINAYGKPSGRVFAYGKYLNYIATEQLSPLYLATFVVAAAGLLLAWWRRPGRLTARLRALSDSDLLLLAWAVVPFLVFATRVSTVHSRYLMPFLPPFAIWIALALWRVRPTTLRAATIGVVLLLAWAQFVIISFDSLGGWRDRFTVTLPTGPLNLLAHGFSIQYAAAGVTDPRFAVTQEILSEIEAGRVAAGRERISLGLVVNAYQLHEKHFLYEIYTRFPHVELRELARNWTGRPTYPQLFEMDYVLLDDTHSYRTAEESQRVTERILTHPNDRFNRAFREVGRWELPSGNTILLYARRFAATEPGISPESYHQAMQALGPVWGEGDALVLTAPDQAYIVNALLPEDLSYDVVPLPAADGSNPAATLATLAQQQRRLFLLSRNAEKVAGGDAVEGWLRANTLPGPEQWVNDLRVAAFVPGAPAAAPTLPLDARFGDGVATLTGAALSTDEVTPGGALPLTLFWQAPGEPGEIKVFVHLLGPDGALVAQRDTALADGAQPHALLIPRDAPPGSYRLVVGLYRASDGERLPVTQDSAAPADRAVTAATVQVAAE